MLTGENGILTQAQKAKEETEKASVIEQAQTDILGIQSDGNTTITQRQLKDVLDKYFDSVPDDVNTSDVLKTKEEYGGKYSIAVSDIYNGELKGAIPKGLKIGSEVHYDPNGKYTTEDGKNPLSETYSGSNSNPVQIDSSTSEFNIDTWRVFDIDGTTGKIRLVPEHSTEEHSTGAGTIHLRGAQGYNNAVNILDDACNKLYGNEDKGITAESIDMDDIEGKMTVAALKQAHSYNGGAVPYGEPISAAYSQNNSYYPIIYEKEALRSIDDNGNVNHSGLEISDKTSSLIEPGKTYGYVKASIGIQPTETYWKEANSFMQTAFQEKDGVNFYDLLFPDGVDTYYWVASRSIYTYADACDFVVYSVSKGELGYGAWFYSDAKYLVEGYYGLFPIVSLNPELISKDSNSEFVVE